MSRTTIQAAHAGDQQLAALRDGDLAERDARHWREHLQACSDCRQRAEQLEGLIEVLARPFADNPALVGRVLAEAAADAPRQPGRSPRRWARPVLVGSGLAAAGLVALLLWPGAELGTDAGFTSGVGWQVRGDDPAKATVQLSLFHQATELQALRPGASLPAGELRMALQLTHLPAAGSRRVAVYARGADGRVTWLLPAWIDADTLPVCPLLPTAAGTRTPAEGVAFVAVPGTLEIGLLVLERDCDLAALDARLEAGWQPAVGQQQLVEVQQQHFVIRAM